MKYITKYKISFFFFKMKMKLRPIIHWNKIRKFKKTAKLLKTDISKHDAETITVLAIKALELEKIFKGDNWKDISRGMM